MPQHRVLLPAFVELPESVELLPARWMQELLGDTPAPRRPVAESTAPKPRPQAPELPPMRLATPEGPVKGCGSLQEMLEMIHYTSEVVQPPRR